MDPSGILHSQIQAAAAIWEEIKNSSIPADRWLGNYFHRFRKKFGSRDRRFLSETIYSLFRHKAFLEIQTAELKNSSPELLTLMAAAMEGFVSEVEFHKLMPNYVTYRDESEALYSLLRHRRLPPIAFESMKTEEEKMAARFSFPLWLVRRWTGLFGEAQTTQLLESFQTRPPLVIRTNTLKITRDKLLERLGQYDLKASPTKLSPEGIVFSERLNAFDSEEFREGFFEVQDEGSQLLCRHIEAKPGMIVWDVCAGGGGKSLALAAMMKNKGRIVATDIRIKKLEDLKKRAKRAGAFNIFPADLGRLSESRELKKGADIILVDAPCSGTGTYRRNPDAKWKIKEGAFEVFHREQVDIVQKALPYLAPGGKLYYATCSVEPLENEDVMKEILEKNPKLVPGCVGEKGEPYLRLLPHQHGTDGFFLAMAENR